MIVSLTIFSWPLLLWLASLAPVILAFAKKGLAMFGLNRRARQTLRTLIAYGEKDRQLEESRRIKFAIIDWSADPKEEKDRKSSIVCEEYEYRWRLLQQETRNAIANCQEMGVSRWRINLIL